MNTACFPDRRPNDFCPIDSVSGSAPTLLCRDEFDDDEGEGESFGFDSLGWDDDDDGEFDPEPSDEDFDDDFEIEPLSDEAERPPEELWNDADWE
jgi:hypothetical protein